MFASFSVHYYHHSVFKSLRGNNEDTPQMLYISFITSSMSSFEEPSRLRDLFARRDGSLS